MKGKITDTHASRTISLKKKKNKNQDNILQSPRQRIKNTIYTTKTKDASCPKNILQESADKIIFYIHL